VRIHAEVFRRPGGALAELIPARAWQPIVGAQTSPGARPMSLLDTPKRLLAIAETVNRWAGAIAALDRTRRAKVARYADAIAATLGRAARHSARLAASSDDRAAEAGVAREFGRISGYLETLVGVLKHHLDGRKLAGVKRRLEQLAPGQTAGVRGVRSAKLRVDRLLAAEGYFRALADSLRV